MARPLYDFSDNQVANLLTLSGGTASAIVSRTLVEHGGIKQVLFAMDAQQEMSEHRAPFPATVHMLSGSLDFSVGGQVHRLGPNAWVSMAPGAPHGLVALEPSVFLLTLIKSPGGEG